MKHTVVQKFFQFLWFQKCRKYNDGSKKSPYRKYTMFQIKMDLKNP